MSIVSETLVNLLSEHLDRHQIVVWFDPELAYTGLAAHLKLEGTNFTRYDPQRGFLALRRELEPLWSQPQRPRLLIYAPLASKDTHNALVEYVKSGVVLEPGGSGSQNTRLAIVTRLALETILPAATLETLLKDVEAGKLSLAEIEKLAERGQSALMGALSLIFHTSNSQEIALHFLTDPGVDRELAAKSAGPALASLLTEALDVDLGAGDDLAGLRSALTRHLLAVEFILSLAEAVPVALQTVPIPAGRAARETAVEIVRTWRLRRDLVPAYIQSAQKLEAELGLGGLEWEIPALHSSETFVRTETGLQTLVETALVEKPSADLLNLAEARLAGFWSAHKPEVKLHWQVIVGAAQVLLKAQTIRQAIKTDMSAGVLFKRYTAEDGWYQLDAFQRHLERDFHNYDAEPSASDALLKLVSASQQAYAQTVDALASRFVHAYETAGFSLPGVIQQAETYHDFVEPGAAEAPVAYFLVDAFRYEMARELCSQLPDEWKVELIPALATPPTITEVGMAALMPWAERGVTIAPVGASKLGVQVGSLMLKSRADRVKWLEEKAQKPLVVTELNKIAPLKDKHLIADIKNARLVLVTASDEIDGLWESQPHLARQLHDHVFDQLRRGIRSLFGQGITKIIITADHGFLMGDRLMLGDALDVPGGDTADLHRRVWVGKGGAAVGECLRKPLSAFGIGGDLELVTPYGMSCFKALGGSNEYFHGGLSLQEITIPVISISAGKAKLTSGMPAFQWTLKPGSKKITTRFFTVTIEGTSSDLFANPPRVHVELRAGNQIISAPISASYGFNDITREVSMVFGENNPGHLATNAITLQITEIPQVESVKLYLLDELGTSLCAELTLPLAIVF